MLTPEQIEARRGKLTASAVGYLLSGDNQKIHNLWRELIGDPNYQREDLSHIWPIQLGNTTEQLNLDWYERKTGFKVSRRGEVVPHSTCEWAACTLDGWVEELKCPIETKHVGGHEPFDRIVHRYAAQCQWQIDVMRSHQCVFSVISAANEPRLEILDNNPEFSKELWDRADHFMECVYNLTPPVNLPEIEAKPIIQKWRDVDFTGNNEWANQAHEWLEHRQSAKRAQKAEEELKALVPADAREAKGHGVKISRNKASHLMLKAA